jgi:hypothetical protein
MNIMFTYTFSMVKRDYRIVWINMHKGFTKLFSTNFGKTSPKVNQYTSQGLHLPASTFSVYFGKTSRNVYQYISQGLQLETSKFLVYMDQCKYKHSNFFAILLIKFAFNMACFHFT